MITGLSGISNSVVKSYFNHDLRFTSSRSMNFIDIKESAYMPWIRWREQLPLGTDDFGVSVGVVTVMFMVSIIQG